MENAMPYQEMSGSHGASGRDDESEIEQLRHRIQALQTDVAQADRRLRNTIRERPFLALGVALAAGFILGRVIGRS
jgi:ElaB/YqjD/DUF883 family membrane-anchored ribosome-binding protein